MTTGNRDTLEARLANEEWGESIEYTLGVTIDGSVDPTGEYPKRDHWFSLSINQAARGYTTNNLWIGGSSLGVNYDIPRQSHSIFPFSQTNATPSGHSFEIDDTPGAERVLIKHHTGAGVELKPDGSVIVASRSHRIEVVGADHNVLVTGGGNITYDGDLNLTVNGNYNVKVGGTYNLEVGANHNENIIGSHRSEIGDVFAHYTRGNKDVRVYGNEVNFHVGEKKIVTKKDIRFLLGDQSDFIVNGGLGVRFTLNENSMFVVSSASKVVIGAEELFVFGKKGKIGSDKMHFFGELYTGPSVVEGEGEGNHPGPREGNDIGTRAVFMGNLVGRALEAWTSKYSKHAEEAHSAHYATNAAKAISAIGLSSSEVEVGIPSTMTDILGYNFLMDDGWWNVNDSSINMWDYQKASGITRAKNHITPFYTPREKWTETWLKATVYGVRKVIIDPDDEIEYKLGKVDNYSHYFTWDPSTEDIRSKLRTMDGAADKFDETNAAQCIGALLTENRLSPDYKLPAPKAPYQIKRLANKLPTPKYGYTLLGNPVERRSKTFLPKLKAGTRTVLADPLYNPDKREAPITSSTKLSKSCTISKFLGAPGSKSSLEYIPNRNRRLELARQWYLHAWIMSIIDSTEEFKDYRLQVTEGYYNPANGVNPKYKPEENVNTRKFWREPYRREDGGNIQKALDGTPINQLKYEGKAVVYTLYNSRGKIDYSKTFELALWIRDNCYYDQLSLDYDYTRPDGKMTQQLLIVMPKIDSSWKANFKLQVCTYFNRRLLSGSDLVEITD
jgi:acyl CoA:acetate/3-ketoacid CoA transferase beta subunit